MAPARFSYRRAFGEAFDWFARGTVVGLFGTVLVLGMGLEVPDWPRVEPSPMVVSLKAPDSAGTRPDLDAAVVVTPRPAEATVSPRPRRSRRPTPRSLRMASALTTKVEAKSTLEPPPAREAVSPRSLIRNCSDAEALIVELDAQRGDACRRGYAQAAAMILQDKQRSCLPWTAEGLDDVILHLRDGKKACGSWPSGKLERLASGSLK